MTIISLIVVIDEAHGIGKNNALLCHLPADLKHFKQLTMGKPIIMGHRTYESIGRPLPGRLNIVLSRRNLTIDGVTVVNSLEQALDLTRDVHEVMIIGGGMLFKESLPLAQHVYVTRIHHQFEADIFFPELDLNKWTCTKLYTFNRDDKNAYDMTFYRYDACNFFEKK